jgi:hypothetical protein
MRGDKILKQLTGFFYENRPKIKITDEPKKMVARYKELAEYTLMRYEVRV